MVFRLGCRALGEAGEVVRAARFGAGAGQALAAEGLAPHHRADLVAVDVDVAGFDGGDDRLHAVVDAGMQAEGQAVAGRVDGLDHIGHAAGGEGRDVQDGAEDFLRHILDALHADHGGADEGAGGRGGQFLDHPALGAGFGDIGGDGGLRL